jgi:hypothetical protein
MAMACQTMAMACQTMRRDCRHCATPADVAQRYLRVHQTMAMAYQTMAMAYLRVHLLRAPSSHGPVPSPNRTSSILHPCLLHPAARPLSTPCGTCYRSTGTDPSQGTPPFISLPAGPGWRAQVAGWVRSTGPGQAMDSGAARQLACTGGQFACTGGPGGQAGRLLPRPGNVGGLRLRVRRHGPVSRRSWGLLRQGAGPALPAPAA